MVTQKNGATYTRCRAYGRKRVTPVMPGIGNNRLRIQLPALEYGILIKHFLENDGYQCSHQCQYTGFLQRAALQEAVNGGSPVPENAESHKQQKNTDNGSCQRLVLAMTVIVSFIFGLCRNAHKNNDNNICNEIRQRMYRIRQHGGTVTYNTCKEFEDKQEKVYHTSHNRHPVNVFFPCGICFFVQSLHFHLLFV